MSVKLLTEHHLEFLSLKGGCIGSSKSTLVKIINANLLEITCRSSYFVSFQQIQTLVMYHRDTEDLQKHAMTSMKG